jgi:tetratricopeptide (TPR) repeat protein
MRCEASTQGLHLISATMADAEELMRLAPRGSIPWAQAVQTYFSGMLLAGRSRELPPSVAVLRDVVPAPDAVGRMALVYLNGIWTLDNLGYVRDGNALEERFFEIIRTMGRGEPFAQFWWDITVGVRGTYAHEDPWSALQHSEAIQPIFDETRSELMFLNMQLFRALNLWFLGASVIAEPLLEEIPGADEKLGVVSALRRFSLAWLRADRGAFEPARAVATELRDAGRAQRNPLDEARGSWVLAEVLRRMGDLEAAEREILAALRLEASSPLEYPGALATLAALRLAQGRVEPALAAAQDAVARYAAMGGCGVFRGAFVRLAHVEALHATGAGDAARSAIADAREHLIAVAGRIAEPDHKRSFLEDVPENARIFALAREWLGDASPGASPPEG